MVGEESLGCVAGEEVRERLGFVGGFILGIIGSYGRVLSRGML